DRQEQKFSQELQCRPQLAEQRQSPPGYLAESASHAQSHGPEETWHEQEHSGNTARHCRQIDAPAERNQKIAFVLHSAEKSRHAKYAAALPTHHLLDIIGGMNSIAGFSLHKLQLLLLCVAASIGLFVAKLPSATARDPWTAAQTVQPAPLLTGLTQEKDPHPLVIYVGMRTLYNGGHIPGALFYGPGSTER